jgi:radical SAM superfamily enzyme YgiQ (UPF0313 family)
MFSLQIVVPPWKYWHNPLKVQPLWELYYATLIKERFPQADVNLIDLRESESDEPGFSIPESDIYFYWIMKSADAFDVYDKVRILREAYPKSIHLAGGTHVEHCMEECINIFDSVYSGTGEELIVESIENFKNGHLKKHYSSENTYPFENYSHPSRHFIPHNRIVNTDHFLQYGEIPGTSLYFSRGCNFSCNFCIYNFPKKFEYRRPDQIISEIEYLKKEFKVKAINLKDEVCIPPNINTCREYLEAIGKTDITWRGQTVPIGSEDMIRLARDSGCVELALGIESVDSDKVLEIANKPSPSVEKNREFIKMVKKHGIRVKLCFVFGLPGESRGVMKKTMEYIEDVQPDYVSVSGFDPIPGSYFNKNAKTYGIKSIDPDLSKHAHLLFRFGDNEDVGLPFEFEKETHWGPSFTREEIVTNIRQFQEFLNKNNMVY